MGQSDEETRHQEQSCHQHGEVRCYLADSWCSNDSISDDTMSTNTVQHHYNTVQYHNNTALCLYNTVLYHYNTVYQYIGHLMTLLCMIDDYVHKTGLIYLVAC